MDEPTLKTWRDIEVAAVTDPLLHPMVTLVERADFTKEQALIFTVLALVDVNQQLHVRLLDHLRRQPYSAIVPASGLDGP